MSNLQNVVFSRFCRLDAILDIFSLAYGDIYQWYIINYNTTARMSGFKLPDLRFEESFVKTLYSYAGHEISDYDTPSASGALTEKELVQLNEELDHEEQRIVRSTSDLRPLEPISSSIIAYAVVKDQIIMPLIQGFLWTGLLISIRPFLGVVVAQGQRCGMWLSTVLGLNRIAKTPNAYVYRRSK